jgi:hypothetical protein
MKLLAPSLALLLALSATLARADAPEALRVDVTMKVFKRSFAYNDDYFGFLRNFSGASPMLGIRGEVFPGAFFAGNVLADIGVYFDLSRSFGLESERSDGQRFPTTYATRELGLLVRQRIRRQSLALRFGYGGHRFELENSGPARPNATVTPDVPSVDYRFLRIGFESQLRVWNELRLTPSFAYLPVFDTGGLESDVWFPRTQSGGITAGLEVSHRFMGTLDLFLAFEYRRFFHSFHPQVGDPFIAGGAADDYYVVSFGGRYVLPGKSSGSGSSAPK